MHGSYEKNEKKFGQMENNGMPRGPQGQKSPADVVGCAVVVSKIATEELPPDAPISGRIRSGRAGAKGPDG
jgi:hypothetical protein